MTHWKIATSRSKGNSFLYFSCRGAPMSFTSNKKMATNQWMKSRVQNLPRAANHSARNCASISKHCNPMLWRCSRNFIFWQICLLEIRGIVDIYFFMVSTLNRKLWFRHRFGGSCCIDDSKRYFQIINVFERFFNFP